MLLRKVSSLWSFLLSNPWRLAALIFALLNIKSLPFVWHIRLIHGLFLHIRTSQLRRRAFLGPRTLFKPVITTSRSGPLECDYNLHKSNSTYFSDFDVGRLQLLVSLIGHGVDVMSRDLQGDCSRASAEHIKGLVIPKSEQSKKFSIVLGAVTCHFHREIKPMEGFEIWTRILTWDRKWLFVVGHFVRKGTTKPHGGYLYQPWKSHSKHGANQGQVDGSGSQEPSPERVIRASGLLCQNTAVDGSTGLGPSVGEGVTPALAEDELASTLLMDGPAEAWTMQRVEKERLRGLQIAESLNNLDGLTQEFSGEHCQALGHYP